MAKKQDLKNHSDQDADVENKLNKKEEYNNSLIKGLPQEGRIMGKKQSTKEEINQQEEYAGMVNSNTILLSFEGWIKYIEGFVRGIQTTEKVNSEVVMDCVGEILEYMTQLRTQVQNILVHCEKVLTENEDLLLENKELKQQFNLVDVHIIGEGDIDGKEM